MLAISPPRPGPWVEELGELARAGVTDLLLRLGEQPEALVEVLEAATSAMERGDARLQLRVRPYRPEDIALARAHGLALHGEAGASRSCHDEASLARAAADGCDFALLSPVFPPGSKPSDPRPPLGVQGFARLAAGAGLPVVALGGLDSLRVAGLRAAGASGVAGIGAFFQAGRVDGEGARRMVHAWAQAT